MSGTDNTYYPAQPLLHFMIAFQQTDIKKPGFRFFVIIKKSMALYSNSIKTFRLESKYQNKKEFAYGIFPNFILRDMDQQDAEAELLPCSKRQQLRSRVFF